MPHAATVDCERGTAKGSLGQACQLCAVMAVARPLAWGAWEPWERLPVGLLVRPVQQAEVGPRLLRLQIYASCSRLVPRRHPCSRPLLDPLLVLFAERESLCGPRRKLPVNRGSCPFETRTRMRGS